MGWELINLLQFKGSIFAAYGIGAPFFKQQ